MISVYLPHLARASKNLVPAQCTLRCFYLFHLFYLRPSYKAPNSSFSSISNNSLTFRHSLIVHFAAAAISEATLHLVAACFTGIC